MKIVFASYVYTPEYKRPEDWLDRIKFFSGMLHELAVKHTVISIEQIDFEGEYTANGVHYYFKRYTKTQRRLPLKMHRFIKSLEPDVVFINGLHFPLQVIQLRLHLNSKIRIMAQHHAEQPFIGLKKVAQQMADRCIDAYLFASRDMGMEWVNKGVLKRSDKIHGVMEVSSVFYPVDLHEARAKTGVEGDNTFLWVGRLNQNKDPLTMVKGFLAFAKRYPDAKLYMIYQTEELLPAITRLLDGDIHDSIVLVGKIAHAELLYWYNSVDFIVSGSHYEGSSTVVCEAMSCGCMPLVTDILSFRMMTNNGDCGILYEPGNPDDLLSALKQTRQINIAEKRAKVLAYFKEKLSFGAIAAKVEEVASSL